MVLEIVALLSSGLSVCDSLQQILGGRLFGDEIAQFQWMLSTLQHVDPALFFTILESVRFR